MRNINRILDCSVPRERRVDFDEGEGLDTWYSLREAREVLRDCAHGNVDVEVVQGLLAKWDRVPGWRLEAEAKRKARRKAP